jgi:hypothetical protein
MGGSDGHSNGFHGSRPVSAGPEMDALGRFYQDVTWKGVIHEGGMGPGTPAMTGIGHSTRHVIQDGRWIVVDSEQDSSSRTAPSC